MANIADEVLKEMEALEDKKKKAIDELLAERDRIDAQLAMLGHQVNKRGRPLGSKNKTSKKAASK